MRLILPRPLASKIIGGLREDEEVCGFLLGLEGEDFRVLDVVFARNELHSPTSFRINPREVLEIMERAEGRGLQLVGIFHSHLHCPPIPSPDDLRGMELWNVPWLITDGREMRAWILKDGKVVEVELSLE